MNYFESIDDVILFNWWKIREGKLHYCRKNLQVGTKKQDELAFIRINDSHMVEFGIGKEMEEVIELRRRLADLQCDLVIDDDTFLRNEIRRIEKELFDIMTKEPSMDRDGLVIHLEKWLGFRIDEHKVTARKFYKIVGEFEKEQIAIAKANS